MSATYPPMVVAAARVLCRRGAEQCHVDFDDSWKLYGEDYLQDAKQALDAAGAPELLEALVALEAYVANNIATDYPTGIDLEGAQFEQARAAISKATGGMP